VAAEVVAGHPLPRGQRRPAKAKQEQADGGTGTAQADA
jgi:hypothetical protein